MTTNEQDGYGIEAALQYGFQGSSHNEGAGTDTYLCTESQLIAFAKACERKGLAEAIEKARTHRGRDSLSDVADILEKRIEALDAELTPIREAEEVRFMMAQDYVRDADGRWAKSALLCSDCGTNAADLPSKLCPGCQAYREHQS